MIKSNTEKQARFRKKEALKRHAGQIFRLLQMGIYNLSDTATLQEIQYNLDKIIDLPSDWTDKDFERAWLNLERFQQDYRYSNLLLENDVKDTRNLNNEFMTTPDPEKFIKDEKTAIENTRALASHIVSALKLSACSDSDKAAALIDAARFVGRALANHMEPPRSKATAVCLSTMGPQYERPKWFVELFAETVGWQVGKETAHEIGKRLIKFKN